MTFKDLNLNTALWNALEEMEYITPTPIQIESFPIIMSGKDVVGIAQTGTGKTFAFLLPLLRMHQFSKEKRPRTLVLVPTRELVLQIVKELEKLTKYINIRIAGVYGGTNIRTQGLQFLDGIDMVIGTPGRVMDLMLNGVINVKKLRKLVIDEVDEMLNLGFRGQLMSILDSLPERRQNLLFSATLTKEVKSIIEDYFFQPQLIEIAPHGTPLAKIDQCAYHIPNYYSKVNLLTHILNTDDSLQKVLIFTATKKLADRLFEQIQADFPDQIAVIHSNKSQNYRIRSVENFDNGTRRILIATDIIARGLDFQDVTHVINFDTPETPSDYIHRIGRTGRADKPGAAITFIKNMEMERQMEIERLMKQLIPLKEVPAEVELSDVLLEEEKERLGGDKAYLPSKKSGSKGAFHDKKLKNTKVNRAHEKRQARLEQKKKARRRKKK